MLFGASLATRPEPVILIAACRDDVGGISWSARRSETADRLERGGDKGGKHGGGDGQRRGYSLSVEAG
jgi:hypothetical protein